MDDTIPTKNSLKHRAQLLQDLKDVRYKMKEKKAVTKYGEAWNSLTTDEQFAIMMDDMNKKHDIHTKC
jgi:hypothetical protein